METVWMGNYYDYRAAFFSDVMYSNNVPGKEGALLYRDPARALQMALLYQVLPCKSRLPRNLFYFFSCLSAVQEVRPSLVRHPKRHVLQRLRGRRRPCRPVQSPAGEPLRLFASFACPRVLPAPASR